jgi:hypothetical protein
MSGQTLRVLVVSADREFVRVANAAGESHDLYILMAGDVASAAEILADKPVALALLDGRSEGALALVHHVRALAEGASVALALDPEDADTLRGALDLGIDALLTTPLTGDGFLRVVAKVREERALRVHRAFHEPDFERAKKSITELRRLVDAAALGDRELVAAAHDTLAEIAPSVRASIDLRFSPDEPITEASADVPRLALGQEGRESGTIELSGGTPFDRAVALEVASILSRLLALRTAADRGDPPSASSRIVDKRLFFDLLSREVDKANRHRRSLSLLNIDLGDVDLGALTEHLRTSDVVGRADRDIYVLLPETGSVGATQLRRRVACGVAGVATLPRDGTTKEALLAVARKRRELLARSPVTIAARGPRSGAEPPVANPPMDLAELIEQMLARPLQDAGAHTIYPLVLGLPAAASMVRHACLAAARHGDAFVDVGGASTLVSAAREAERENTERLAAAEHPVPSELFVVVLTSEAGVWACTGKVGDDSVSAVHGADPVFADRLAGALFQFERDAADTEREGA